MSEPRKITESMREKLPSGVREAYEWAERFDPAGILKEWRDDQMVTFVAWQEKEARFEWWLKWTGGPAIAVLLGLWAWAMVYFSVQMGR